MKVSANKLGVFNIMLPYAITGGIEGTSRKFRNWTFTKLKVLFYLQTCLALFKKAVTYNTHSLEDIATLYNRTGIFMY